MSLIKQLTAILFLAILTTASAQEGDSSAFLVDKIVASVGGELILLSEVNEQMAILKERGNDPGEKGKCAILQNLILQNLLLNQSKLDSIEVTEEEVEAQLEARIDQILGMMNNDIDYFEEYYGMSINEVKREFRSDLMDKLLVERMQSQIVRNVKVTPSEVKDFFNDIPRDSLPYFSSEVEYREIVFKPEPSEASKEAVIDLLQRLRDRIEEGEDFAELAGRYSEDPGSASQGGDLGWQKRGTFVPEFEAAVFNLKAGELSPVTKSPFGYHLIQLIDRRGNNVNARHILMSPDILDEDIEKKIALADSVAKLIAADSISFEFAVQKYSYDKEQSSTNGGRVMNPATGNTFFEIDQLEPDIYFTLDSLEINDISAGFVDRNARREKIVRVIQLLDRTDPHQANLDEDYNKISEAAKEQKKSKHLNNWMKDKLENTYIRVDKLFEYCPSMLDQLDQLQSQSMSN